MPDSPLNSDQGVRDRLVHRIAAELDMPSLYMGGPSLPSKRKAARIVDILPELEDHASVCLERDRLRAENERLRKDLGERDDYLYEIGKLSRAYEEYLAGLSAPSDEEGRSDG